MTNKTHRATHHLKQAILDAERFSKECEYSQYTDTGEAWDIINELTRTGQKLLEALNLIAHD